MLNLFLSLGISCSEGQKLINNIFNYSNISSTVKYELIDQIKDSIPKCSFIEDINERPKCN